MYSAQVVRKPMGRASIIVPQVRERIAFSYACGASIRKLAHDYHVLQCVVEDAIREYINADPRTSPASRVAAVIPLRRAA